MTLTADELGLANSLIKKLGGYEYRNSLLERYYEGKNPLKDFNISIPPALKTVETVVGWPSTVVQVLEERLDLEGFIAPEALGINDIYRMNDLGIESSLGHLDALIYGASFVVVGKGAAGEPDPLITVESPRYMTGVYDMRLRRLTSALRIEKDNVGRPKYATLYLPNETIFIEYSNGQALELDRDVHNLGRVPVVYLANNPRASDPYGKTEVSRAIRYYTDAAVRTVLGSEVAREFYSAPQRYILGADPEYFMDPDGNSLNPWTVYAGRIMGVPANEDGNLPTVGQFGAGDTRPYFDQIKSLAQMVAAEAAMPASYLGFQTDNPASADAIRQMESRLVKRAERRQSQFGRGWVEVAKLALLIRDGSIPAEADNISAIWRDASTPTRAAAADEAVKLVSVGVFTPDSEILYNRIGLSDSDKLVLRDEKRKAQAVGLVSQLAEANRAGVVETQAQEVATEAVEEDRGFTVDTFQDISLGDIVEFEFGYGQIEHIMTGGTLGIEGSEFAIEATPENPALQVRLWIYENEQWVATPEVYGTTYNSVTRLDALPENPNESDTNTTGE